jgi:glycosyltransferase involved in cell wall biosynthesis
MRILALEPYYGGSHRAFLDGWAAASRHDWTVLSARPHGWKWRMRHTAFTFAEEASRRCDQGATWDMVLCSDMLNLAEFAGLCPPSVHGLPRLAYFHENQWTYPVRHDEPRDVHFGMINMSTALAADVVWFNSAFHREEFLDGLTGFLQKMRPPQLLDRIETIRRRSHVQPPGVSVAHHVAQRPPGPLHIGWVARWEHDKGPATFFDALESLLATGVDFRLSVIGEQFSHVPSVFGEARAKLGDRVVHWGYQKGRAAYERALAEMDVVVSTAEHEFFGLSMVEAALAGTAVLLPERLAYPEVFGPVEGERAELFYDGTVASLAGRLCDLSRRVAGGDDLAGERWTARQVANRYDWSVRSAEMDEALEKVASKRM